MVTARLIWLGMEVERGVVFSSPDYLWILK